MNPDQPMPPMGMGSDKKSGIGALVGSIIVILILVLGALYFWGGKLEQTGDEGAALEQSSDEVATIDADFGGMETINLDEDLNALNQ